MRVLAPGLWRWTGRHPEWHPGEFGRQVASFALRDGDDTVLIDPLLPEEAEPVLAALDGIVAGRLRIIVTIPYHVRSSEELWRRYRGGREVTIHGHRLVGRRLSDPTAFRPHAPGDRLDGGLLACAIGRPVRAEMPVWLPTHRALAFGDAIVEAGGELRVWQSPPRTERGARWYAERLIPTFRRLTELDVERVLVTHGEPVLVDGAAALARALERPPWTPRRRREAASG